MLLSGGLGAIRGDGCKENHCVEREIDTRKENPQSKTKERKEGGTKEVRDKEEVELTKN